MHVFPLISMSPHSPSFPPISLDALIFLLLFSLTFFFSSGQGQCLQADLTVAILAAQTPGSCGREIWREHQSIHCRYMYY